MQTKLKLADKKIEEEKYKLNKFWRDQNFKVEMEGKLLTLRECYELIIKRNKKIFKNTNKITEQEIPKNKYILYVNETQKGIMDQPNTKFIDEDRILKMWEADTGNAPWGEDYQVANMRYCLGFKSNDARFKAINTFRDKTPTDLSNCVGIVFSGGEANIRDETNPEMIRVVGNVRKLVKNAKKLKIPMLGICLGAQLLANEEGLEIDWVKDKNGKRKRSTGIQKIIKTKVDNDLLKTLPDEFFAVENHGQEIEYTKGGYGDILAVNEYGKIEIIDFKNTNIICIQSHIEASENKINIRESINGTNNTNTFKQNIDIGREIIFPIFLRRAGLYAKIKSFV